MDKIRKLHILNLNEDCLISIFKYLKFEDFLILYKINSRFNNAIGASLAYHKTEIVFTDDSNLEQMENFLKLFGKQVKKLNVDSENYQVIEMVNKYCTAGNVKFAKLCPTDGLGLLNTNNNFFKSLKSLKFNCGSASDDELLYQILDTLNQIEYFELSCYVEVTDFVHCISKLSVLPLKTLDIRYLRKMTENEILN